ncbi:hypothetical protein ACFYXH_38655 [Streptomyces sp. NPDC002730]|uniref:hypothetical protein n=1 Tax=Streptomyces sp. NPDC002730 TaxID=3364662 RepID=UPI003673E6ED
MSSDDVADVLQGSGSFLRVEVVGVRRGFVGEETGESPVLARFHGEVMAAEVTAGRVRAERKLPITELAAGAMYSSGFLGGIFVTWSCSAAPM